MPKETVGDIKINYEVKGHGEPVILITGLGGDTTFWRGMVPLLADKFKVITFDNRGSGLTECPDGHFNNTTLADDVVLLMDHLSIPKAHVLGWSMGGNIAQEIALSHPERVASLTLVSTYMRRPSRSSYMMHVMIDSVRSGGDIKHLFRIMQSLCMTEEAFYKMEKRGNYAEWIPQMSLEQFVYQMEAVDGFDSRQWAKNIKVPTRVIHGRSDIMVPPRMGQELSAEIKGSDFILIDGGGHTMTPKDYVGAFLEHALRHPIV